MENTSIIKEEVIDAPLSKVWEAITDKDKMKAWYFDIAEFKAEPGFEFMFLGGDEEKQYAHFCKIIEVAPGKKISYTWKYNEFPNETLVTFELFEIGEDKTKVKLTHEGVDKFPQDGGFARENFVAGWNHIIGTSLKEYLEK